MLSFFFFGVRQKAFWVSPGNMGGVLTFRIKDPISILGCSRYSLVPPAPPYPKPEAYLGLRWFKGEPGGVV